MQSTDVIYPEIEPGVIGREMIEKVFKQADYTGEKMRLHQLEEFAYEKLTALRLEFLNILRIDHLWMMPNLTVLSLCSNKIEVIENIGMLTNLKELNLSFNYISKIENISTLVNLEILSLFGNLIAVIEGIEHLEKLVILSLGNNKFETVEGIEKLRFLKSLRVLNMEENPVCNTLEYPLSFYIAAVLPDLVYYNYTFIEEDVRAEATEKFARELRDIATNEEDEMALRARLEREKLDGERLSSSFVEYLNEHQLFDSMWEDDEDGRVLISMEGEEVAELLADYRNDFYHLTQELYKLGLEKYEERQNEINLFNNSVNLGQKAMQESGHQIINSYLKEKKKIFEDASFILRQIETREARGEDETTHEFEALLDQFQRVQTQFDAATNQCWQDLMRDETYLVESMREVVAIFEQNISEMMSKFIEQVQFIFAQIREVAVHFSENLSEIVQHYLSRKTSAQQFDDVPEGLMACILDKEVFQNMLAGMKDVHTQKIDEREDRISVRGKQFIQGLIDGLYSGELERNRAKVLEVNAFAESMANSLIELQDEIKEKVAQEQ